MARRRCLLCRKRPLELPHDEIVHKLSPAVLASGDAAAQPVLQQREVGVGARACNRIHYVDLGPNRELVVAGGDRQLKPCPRPLLVDRGDGSHNIIPPETAAIVLAIEHDLGRIHKSRTDARVSLPLAFAKAALGIGIGPADVVPIVDVKSQHHYAIRSQTARSQFAHPAVCRRAAAASLGRVELEQGNTTLAGCGAAGRRLRSGGCTQQRVQREGNACCADNEGRIHEQLSFSRDQNLRFRLAINDICYHAPLVAISELILSGFAVIYDLHSHSTRSDGLLTPAELVARAVARGVQVFALTDHDDVGGLREASECAGAAGLRFVNGVEVSVTWHEQTLHVVGLHIDPEHPSLLEGLTRVRAGRTQRAEDMAQGLAKAGVLGALEGASAYVTNPALVGRTHFARFLVDRGYGRDVGAVFRRYLTAGKPGFVPHRWATLEEAVGWITASGGLAVLAHPARYRLGDAAREELLTCFREIGGTAVEVVTGSHTADEQVAWGRFAQGFGLAASAGSDFHGPDESPRDVGSLPPLPEGCRPVWDSF